MTALVCGLACQRVAFAQATAPGDLQGQYDAAFQDMLKKPADLDILFRFATAAAKVGDLEGAISALERMLLVNPDLPRVRLELGVLYYRLGSYEVARTYLEGTLASPSLTPEVRSRAEQFLAQVDKQQSPSRWSGEVFLGWWYQSNANLGPSSQNVLSAGQLASLNQQAAGAADWGLVSSGQVRHIYDFGRQDKAQLETQLTAYANRQFQISAANVSLLDLTIGPRAQIFSGIFEDVTLKPFIEVGYIWVNDTPYYGSYGAGVETSVQLTDNVRNTSTAVWRRHDHQDTWYLPSNGDYRGVEWTANTNFQYAITPLVTLFANGLAQRYQTEQAQSLSYMLLGLGGGFTFRFPDPVLKTALSWTITLSLTEQWWVYDIPDVAVDPTTMRTQADTIANLIFAIPFDERTTFSLTGGRFVRTASIINYAFENNTLMFGVSWRF